MSSARVMVTLALAGLLAGCLGGGLVTAKLDDDDDAVALAQAEARLRQAIAQPGSPTSLRGAYAQYLTLAPVGVERARRAVEYAELLIDIEQFDDAIVHLRGALAMAELELERRADAASLLVDALVALWRQTDGDAERAAAAARVRAALRELEGDAALWAHPRSAGLRERVPSLLAAAGWEIATSHKLAGLAGGGRAEFSACTEEFAGLVNRFPDHPDTEVMLLEAADCAVRAYRIGDLIQIRRALLERYPNSARAPEVILALAHTYEGVLGYREALGYYRMMFERYGDDERAADARTRWLQLAVTLGEPVSDVVASWQDETIDERALAAAVEFRAAQRAGDVAALSAYLDGHRDAGGPAREVAVQVAIAADALRRSCPDSAAMGLCTRRGVDGRLGEVLPRSGPDERRAERALLAARELMREPTWTDDPLAVAGPPLALGPEELRELEATVGLLVGDLWAEDALGVQPPRTYEPSRTRIWLDERKRSVATMIAAYDLVADNDPARAAVAAERTAQVYESDATLLARVAVELRERGAVELAAELDALAQQRLSQALAGYQGCLAAITRHGADPDEVQRTCTHGVGRLAGFHPPEVAMIDESSMRALLLGAN